MSEFIGLPELQELNRLIHSGMENYKKNDPMTLVKMKRVLEDDIFMAQLRIDRINLELERIENMAPANTNAWREENAE